jgi:hypothetical protein
MVLEQQGDRISGVMCMMQTGRVLVNDVPVFGTYPNLRSATETYTFLGKYEEGRDEIAGNAPRFHRAQSGSCEVPGSR